MFQQCRVHFIRMKAGHWVWAARLLLQTRSDVVDMTWPPLAPPAVLSWHRGWIVGGEGKDQDCWEGRREVSVAFMLCPMSSLSTYPSVLSGLHQSKQIVVIHQGVLHGGVKNAFIVLSVMPWSLAGSGCSRGQVHAITPCRTAKHRIGG